MKIINLKFIKVVFLLCVVPYSFSQYSESISSDRPGQAIGGNTVGKSVLQVQPGLDYFSFLNLSSPPRGILASSAFRFGISEKVELNTYVDYQYEQSSFDTTHSFLSGINNLFFGFRTNFFEQKGLVPNTGFQLNLKIPKISNDFGSSQLATNMVLILSWSLPKNTSVTTNWILSYDGNSIYPIGKYALNFGFPVYKNLGGFIENYGQVSQNFYETKFDGGFAYMLNDHFQFDISAGFGSNLNALDYFVSSGISWRIVDFRK